jgi:L-lactate dehydrogenase complex protein LldE
MSETVQLLVTCIVDTLYPQVGEACVNIFESAGIRVNFPEGQTCCGQPAFNAGMRDDARRMAEHTIKVFEDTPGVVVIPSGSCTGMIRNHYDELFAGDPEWLARAKALSERSFEFTEFLVDELGITDLGAFFPGKITYHASCHLLRELGVERQPRTLINAVRGSEIIALPGSEECCGFGGVFSLEHPEISGAMVARKIANIESSGAELVVACDAGCITNINGGLHRGKKTARAIHIAELLNQTEEKPDGA